MIDKDDMETLGQTKAYEKEPNEIKVGDVVCDGPRRGIVTAIYENGQIVTATHKIKSYTEMDVLMQSGSVALRCYTKHFKKTGKHIDISGLLAEIGGAE